VRFANGKDGLGVIGRDGMLLVIRRKKMRSVWIQINFFFLIYYFILIILIYFLNILISLNATCITSVQSASVTSAKMCQIIQKAGPMTILKNKNFAGTFFISLFFKGPKLIFVVFIETNNIF